MIRTLLLTTLLAAPACADEIWVTNEMDDTVSVIDADSFELKATYPTGERPRGITFSKDFKSLYICASDSDAVQVMDPDTGKVLHDLPSGEDPEQFVLDPATGNLFIANENDAITTVVDPVSRKLLAQIDVGVEPEGMGISPDGKVQVTTSETTNMAHWIDTATHQVFANTLVDPRPRFALFSPDGGTLWVSSEIGGTVTVFDAKTQTEKAKIRFEITGVRGEKIQPVGMIFSPDHSKLFVALGPANHVAVIDTTTFAVEKYILAGRRVWQLALSPNGKKCSRPMVYPVMLQ